MESIIEMAAQTGIWAVLFVFLFFYQIKDSKAREEKYQSTIEQLATSLEIVAEIHEKVQEIKQSITQRLTNKVKEGEEEDKKPLE